MANKPYFGRGKDAFDDIHNDLAGHEKRLTFVENNKQPTMPFYEFDNPGDPAALPDDPVEGQIAIGLDDNVLHWFINGEWRSGVGGDWKDLDLQPPWIEVPPFHSPPQYMVLAEEYFFRGAITGGTDTDLVTTLPEEDRPEFFHRYLISRDYEVAFIEIDTDGTVYMKSST